jgi:hypothetical protein
MAMAMAALQILPFMTLVLSGWPAHGTNGVDAASVPARAMRLSTARKNAQSD